MTRLLATREGDAASSMRTIAKALGQTWSRKSKGGVGWGGVGWGGVGLGVEELWQ